MVSRRGFLASILAIGAAPAIVKIDNLMPVRGIIVPRLYRLEIGRIDEFRFFEPDKHDDMMDAVSYLGTSTFLAPINRRALQASLNQHLSGMALAMEFANTRSSVDPGQNPGKPALWTPDPLPLVTPMQKFEKFARRILKS